MLFRSPLRQCYTTRLEFSGDYDQIGTFIQALENRFPQAEIRSLTIGATDAPSVHRVALELVLLVRPAPAASGLPSQKTATKS